MITSVPPILSFSRFVWGGAGLFSRITGAPERIVIGLVEDEYHFSALPSCFNDIIFISRRASLDRISGAVHRPVPRRAGGEQLEAKAAQSVSIKYYHPSKTHYGQFYRGLSVVQIAHALKISDKTVLRKSM